MTPNEDDEKELTLYQIILLSMLAFLLGISTVALLIWLYQF